MEPLSLGTAGANKLSITAPAFITMLAFTMFLFSHEKCFAPNYKIK